MINIIFSCITAFVITFLAIPSIIKVSIIKNLFDEPNLRKTHKSNIPTLGGLAIFGGVVFSFTFWSSGFGYQPVQYIVAALLVMFFISSILPMASSFPKYFLAIDSEMAMVLGCVNTSFTLPLSRG